VSGSRSGGSGSNELLAWHTLPKKDRGALGGFFVSLEKKGLERTYCKREREMAFFGDSKGGAVYGKRPRINGPTSTQTEESHC